MMLNSSKSFVLPLLLAAAALTAACGESPTQPSPPVDFQAIDLVVGAGAEATNGRVIDVHYTGWLYSTSGADNKGTQFDSSAGGQPIRFTLGSGQVIAGWNQGIAGMKVGGRRRLIIPPDLAYGSTGRGPIPPDTALVFDVELVAVQ